MAKKKDAANSRQVLTAEQAVETLREMVAEAEEVTDFGNFYQDVKATLDRVGKPFNGLASIKEATLKFLESLQDGEGQKIATIPFIYQRLKSDNLPMLIRDIDEAIAELLEEGLIYKRVFDFTYYGYGQEPEDE